MGVWLCECGCVNGGVSVAVSVSMGAVVMCGCGKAVEASRAC